MSVVFLWKVLPQPTPAQAHVWTSRGWQLPSQARRRIWFFCSQRGTGDRAGGHQRRKKWGGAILQDAGVASGCLGLMTLWHSLTIATVFRKVLTTPADLSGGIFSRHWRLRCSLCWLAPCGSESHTEPRYKGAAGQYASDTIPVWREPSGHSNFLQIEKTNI